MQTMEKWQGGRVRSPYERPDAEWLSVHFDEQFMQTTFNTSKNEVMSRGEDEDFI